MRALLAEPLREAFGPGVTFVHGAEGIARRIAFLTQGQEFQRTGPDLALFTKDSPDIDALHPALARFGIDRVEIL